MVAAGGFEPPTKEYDSRARHKEIRMFTRPWRAVP